MKHRLLIALAAISLATSAHAAEAFRYVEDRIVQYSTLPNVDELARLFPEAALRRQVSGHAIVLCRAANNGAMAGCRIVAEAPQGYGFGRAALLVATRLKLKPTAEDGSLVAGAVVPFNLVMNLPDGNGRVPGLDPLKSAWLLKPLRAGTKPGDGRVSCSNSPSSGLCEFKALEFERQPGFQDVIPAIRLAGDAQPTALECTLSPTGVVSGCAAETLSPDLLAALSKLIPQYRASPDARRAPEQKIVITYDWPRLKAWLATAEEVAATPIDAATR